MVRAPHKSRAVRTVAAIVAAAAFFGLAALLAGQATGVQSHSSVAIVPSAGATTAAPAISSLPNRSAGTPPAGATTTTTLPPLGTKVAIVGDSLTEGIVSRLPALEPRFGFQAKIDAQTGRDIDAGLGPLQKIMPGEDLVVVALGTNDAHNGLKATDADALIDKMMAEIGPRPVLWVNIYRADTKGTTAAAQLFDTELSAAAERYRNLTVLDWASYIQSRPELMGGDRIHLTDAGYDARAEWLARQITAGLRLPLPDVPELTR
jgi:lysophospholipase L1-like esterase